MLERPELLILPDPAGGRAVLDVGRAPLGRIAVERGPRWLGGRLRRLVATEGADGSLVFSVGRGWLGRTWVVAESDGGSVAWLRGGRVLTAGGRELGRYRGGGCRGWDGREWAAWWPEAGGVRLRFGDALREEPFLKMTALACMLVG